MLAVGFCKSGKSYSIQYTIRTTNAFDFVIVISNTALFNGDYNFLKELGIPHRIYNTSKINEIMEFAMNAQERNIKKGDRVRIALVFDDVMGSLHNNKVFQKLTSCFRHFLITIIVSTQYCNSQTTYVRELANYIYCFDQRTEVSKKAVYASYFNDIGTFGEFKTYFGRLRQFEFFFIDRAGKKRMVMKCPSNQVEVRASEKEEFMKNF